MDVLWKLAMQEGEGIQDALATCAFDNLVELLKLELVAPVRTTYTERCAENLMKSVCMPQSLELLIKIVGTAPPPHTNSFEGFDIDDLFALSDFCICAFFASCRNQPQEGKEEGGGRAGAQVQAPRRVLCRLAEVQARGAQCRGKSAHVVVRRETPLQSLTPPSFVKRVV